MKSMFDRAVRAYNEWRHRRWYRQGNPDASVSFVNGWHYGYAAAKRDAKKARKR